MLLFEPGDMWLEKLAAQTGAGCAYGVTYQGELLHCHCAGERSNGSGEAMTENTLFRIYSLTKLFTCTEAWMLIRRGLLRDEDAIADYLPAFGRSHVLEGERIVSSSKPITIRHLLTMTSGIPYNGSDAPRSGLMLNRPLHKLRTACGANGYTNQQLADCIADSPLAFQPGEQWLYGYSHDVLGAVMEKCTGKRLGELLKEDIFAPLGLRDTSFVLTQPERLADLYVRDKAGGLRRDALADAGYSGVLESGGGGLLSTLRDMTAFTGKLACGDGVWREAAERFEVNQLSDEQLKTYIFPYFGYSCGARTLMDGAGENCGASNMEFGWYGVSGCWVAIDRSRKASIVFLQQIKPSMERYTFPALRELIWKRWRM